jgi:hypothetical protein
MILNKAGDEGGGNGQGAIGSRDFVLPIALFTHGSLFSARRSPPAGWLGTARHVERMERLRGTRSIQSR